MKPYRVTVEVTTTYTVEVHAETANQAECKASLLDLEEIEAGEDQATTSVSVGDAEEIQREDEEDE